MPSRFSRLAATVGVVAALAAGTTSAQTYQPEYRASVVVGLAFPWGQAAQRWADLVAAGTNGRIAITVYPGTSLVGGDQSREFAGIRQGIIDLAIGSTINWSPEIKELNLFSLPFLLPDHQAIDALTQGAVGQRLFEAIAARDVVPLAWGENGFREISNSAGPIRTPSDLKGLKIRYAVSPIFADTLAALGANPIPMNWAEAQPALATGAIDGQENPVTIFDAAKLHTLNQKHLTLWGYVADPLIFVVNRAVWETWTPEDRAVVRQAAIQAGAENIRQTRAGTTGADDAAIKAIEANGVSVVRLGDADKDIFRTVTRPVYDAWARTIGEDLVRMAEHAIAAR